jgi:hypothetical protein
MSASERTVEPTLFDPTPEPQHTAEVVAETPEPASELASEDAAGSAASSPQNDRKRLAEQLEALKRKEAELRRAIAVSDHPELAEAIRTIEGRAFALSRADAKLAQGLSKGEARKREVTEKKLSALREKRAELDTQITTLEGELAGLGADRLAGFERERRDALQDLMVVLATHDAALNAAGLEASGLVPEIESWMTELEALAREVSRAQPSA